jgi:competence protein ComEC
MSDARAMAVYALDVGQGDMTCILPPDEAPVLFDCRDDWVALRFLKSRTKPIMRLSAVVVSHLDWDHIAGLKQFLEQFEGTVDRIYIGDDRDVREGTEGAVTAKELLDYVVEGAEKKRWILRPSAVGDTSIAKGNDWSIDVLAPTQAVVIANHRSAAGLGPNRLSMVLRVRMGDSAVLIGGDAPLATWAEIPQESLSAKVFRIPHHGGRLDGGSQASANVMTNQDLYRAIKPDAAILSLGTNNRWGHPNEDSIAPVMGGACRLLCTQVTPHCEPHIGKNTRRLLESALRSEHFVEVPWRHLTDKNRPVISPKEVPCVGAILVRMYASGAFHVLPEADGTHDRFIRGWARRLCQAN